MTDATHPAVSREPPRFDEPRRRGPAATSSSPLVSTIVRTCEGRRGCLEEAVGSVLSQDHANLELVIVQDGGFEAWGWLESLRLPPHVRIAYQSLPRVGRCVAGNRGLEIARGKYVGFLDDDDLLLPHHVSTLVEVLEKRPELAGAYAVAERVFTRIESYAPFRYQEVRRDIALRERFDRPDLWVRNLFPIQALLFRRDLFREFGGFDPQLVRLEDWDLWTRYTSRHDFALVDRVTSRYRVPADDAEASRRNAELDGCFPELRRRQARIPVRVSPRDLRSLVGSLIEERKYYRLARRLGLADPDRLVAGSPAARAFFANRADGSGDVATTPAEALELARRVLDGSPWLRLLLRLSRQVERRASLKKLADRWTLAAERHP